VDKIAVFVIYDRAIDEEVLAALQECGIASYTRWHNATGVGTTGPHQGDNVWPALNNVLMAVTDSGNQGRILERLRVLREDFPYTGLRALVVPVLDMI
jgi:hypothetical protein